MLQIVVGGHWGADFLAVTVTCCMCFGWTGGFSDFRVCLGSLASRGVGVI